MAVAHLALELGARHESSNRIDDQHVDCARANERVRDFERLLAGIGLGNQQIFDIDPELAGVGRVERMFGVDKSAGPAPTLRLGDYVQRERGLARALRAIDLDDAPARQTTDAEGYVEAKGARRDYFDVGSSLARAELHDRTLAKGAFDLSERRLQSRLLIHHFFVQEAQRALH